MPRLSSRDSSYTEISRLSTRSRRYGTSPEDWTYTGSRIGASRRGMQFDRAEPSAARQIYHQELSSALGQHQRKDQPVGCGRHRLDARAARNVDCRAGKHTDRGVRGSAARDPACDDGDQSSEADNEHHAHHYYQNLERAHAFRAQPKRRAVKRLPGYKPRSSWPGLARGPSAHGLDPWAPTSSSQPIVEIFPIGVISVDQANFPGTGPVLYVHLPLSCGENVCVVFSID